MNRIKNAFLVNGVLKNMQIVWHLTITAKKFLTLIVMSINSRFFPPNCKRPGRSAEMPLDRLGDCIG